jgi:phenylpropionate dioxygenase-like ring-hydroxylating dioxygenase large terminal subunit
MFLRNSWYVAAWDREIGRPPLARMILGEPIVFYRQEDGRPVALEDCCCHRHLPLSLGRLEGDTLRCGYHGLRFDAGGRCVEIPGQAQIPPDAAIRSYPLVERLNWVWIWMGDPKRADPELIPNWWWADHPDWACAKPDMLPVACNCQLINDNLLDVTHLDRQPVDQRFSSNDRARGRSRAANAVDHRSPGATDVSSSRQIRRQR